MVTEFGECSAQNNGQSLDIFQTNLENVRPYKEWPDIMSDQIIST